MGVFGDGIPGETPLGDTSCLRLRLLANIWLKQHDHEVTRWPEADLTGGTSPIRQQYLEAVRAADAGNHEPLIALHRQFT